MSSSIIGTSRSAWPRPISSSRRATQLPARSNRAAVQAAVEVSIASSIASPWLRVGLGYALGSGPQPRCPGKRNCRRLNLQRSDGLDRLDLRHIVADQILDAALEGQFRRRAAVAGALHRQVQTAVLVAAIDDVAA